MTRCLARSVLPSELGLQGRAIPRLIAGVSELRTGVLRMSTDAAGLVLLGRRLWSATFSAVRNGRTASIGTILRSVAPALLGLFGFALLSLLAALHSRPGA